MRVLSPTELEQDPQCYEEIAETLRNDGIVCFPTASSYRVATSLLSENAVVNFLQVKRRTRKAPTLIFVPHQQALESIVREIPPPAKHLMDLYWPGPLTMRFALSDEMPRKIARNLNAKKGVGIRIPENPIALQIVQHFDGPLLISSANLERKKGAHSEAQIRKNFARWLDILISCGDLPGEGQSTVLDVLKDPPAITREGSIDGEEILAAWEQAQNNAPSDNPNESDTSAMNAVG